MEIKAGTVVGLTYELKVSKEEDEIESAPFSVEVREADDPFYFLFGQSGLPEKFEELLEGKKLNEEFSFTLTTEEAYGEADEELLVCCRSVMKVLRNTKSCENMPAGWATSVSVNFWTPVTNRVRVFKVYITRITAAKCMLPRSFLYMIERVLFCAVSTDRRAATRNKTHTTGVRLASVVPVRV